MVQRAAAAAWDEGRDFRAELLASSEVQQALSPAEFESLFDPMSHLQHLDQVFDRLEKLEVRTT